MNKNSSEKVNKAVPIIAFISSITNILANISQLIVSKQTLIESKQAFILLILGVSFFILYWLNKINEKRKVSVGKPLRTYIWALVILIILNVFSIGYILNSYPNNNCVFNKKLIGIGVSNFSNDDNFSALLVEFLNEEKLPKTIFEIKRINRNYFDIISDNYFDKSIDSLHLCSGIIVSGKRNLGEKLFYCKIKLKNLYSRNLSSYNANGLIAVRNPDIKEFSIDYQAQLLSDFIIALVTYSQNNLDKSEELLKKCISQNHNKDNRKFLSICRGYLGNIYLYKNKTKEAIQEYSKSTTLYKNDAALANLANCYSQIGDKKKAKDSYNKIRTKKITNVDDIRMNLQSMHFVSEQIMNSDSKGKRVNLTPQGTFCLMDEDSTLLRINYFSISQFNFENNGYIIFKADNNLFGIINCHGYLISLPKFTDISKAKAYIENL